MFWDGLTSSKNFSKLRHWRKILFSTFTKLVLADMISSTVKMEAICSSETSVATQLTIYFLELTMLFIHRHTDKQLAWLLTPRSSRKSVLCCLQWSIFHRVAYYVRSDKSRPIYCFCHVTPFLFNYQPPKMLDQYYETFYGERAVFFADRIPIWAH
jgi:hypothetical protein